jgi:hypothetical protein
MLDENDVIETVSAYLQKRGYTILRKSRKDPRGVDIVVRDPESKSRLMISATGIAPSKAGRGKLEKSYTESQVFYCVTRAVYSALRTHGTNQFKPGDQIALAFPDSPGFRKYLSAEKAVLDSLAVKIFLITEEKKVILL